ncbi:MAG: hypothetical protein GY788_20755 [bacterium]|nr:hypothetical protein [bacterium]
MIVERVIALGVKALFGGARRGQPIVTAIGAAISIWSLFRRFDNRHKPVYVRKLKDGEVVRVTQFRGVTAVDEDGQ